MSKFANSVTRRDVHAAIGYATMQASPEIGDVIAAAANLLFAPLNRRAEMLRALQTAVHCAQTITVVDEPKIGA